MVRTKDFCGMFLQMICANKITAPLNHHVTSIMTEGAAKNKRSVPKIEDDFVTRKVKKQQVRKSNLFKLYEIQQLTKLFQLSIRMLYLYLHMRNQVLLTNPM